MPAVDRYYQPPLPSDLAKLGLHGAQKGKDLWTGKEVTLTQNMPIEIRQPRHSAGAHSAAKIRRAPNRDSRRAFEAHFSKLEIEKRPASIAAESEIDKWPSFPGVTTSSKSGLRHAKTAILMTKAVRCFFTLQKTPAHNPGSPTRIR